MWYCKNNKCQDEIRQRDGIDGYPAAARRAGGAGSSNQHKVHINDSKETHNVNLTAKVHRLIEKESLLGRWA